MIPKFRAIVDDSDHPLDNEFVYGVYTDGHMVDGVIDSNDEYIAIGAWARVKKETLGQSTGLKDKNGKEVYEGDIVEIEMNDGFDYGSFIGQVEFLEGAWMVNNKINFARNLWSEVDQIELLGNIYENAELLEVE